MSFIGVSAGIGAASLGVGLYKSIHQGSQASAIRASNPRPTYQIPDEYNQNLRLAQQMAQVGLPQQQYNNQLNLINRNQAGAIGALSQSANPGAGLASIVRAGNDATNRLDAQDAAARQANQRLFLQQQAQLGAQKLAAQQYNKFDKYSENFNRAQALDGASNQNFQNSLNGAGQLAGGLAMTRQQPFYGYRYDQIDPSQLNSAGIGNLGFGASPFGGQIGAYTIPR